LLTETVNSPIEYSRVPTGVEGLDIMLNGGLPRGRLVLVRGAPGIGKTILCTQFLYRVAKQGEMGLFVSLEETREELIREMFLVGMDLRPMERAGLIMLLDASPIRHIPAEVKLGNISVGKRDFSLVALANKIKDTVRERKIERVVIDPLTALSLHYPEDNDRRVMVLDLLEVLGHTGATFLMTEDLGTSGSKKVEEYAFHGVILMRTLEAGKARMRTIQIVKMRETRHDDQPRVFRISDEGTVVYPRESIFETSYASE
jgi:KaiC/GvpD/RAD55 family RecA-like ATPase